MRVRFAPSPTGHLHLGSARTAIFNWLFARHSEGDFILRIEDTDRVRSTTFFEKAIIEQLAWLGLNWDEGPDIGGHGAYRQSERADIYRTKAGELLERDLAYRCFCTPKELEASREAQLRAGLPPRYSGTCRDLTSEQIQRFVAEGREAVLRFRMPEEEIVVDDILHGEVKFDGSDVGDFIIVRSDGSAGFHFAVVVDDSEMGITHVIRGNDHLPNSARHVALFKALAYRVPRFAHFGLIVASDGSKLSKRHGAVSIFEYREAGYVPEAINNYLALLGWSPPGEKEVMGLEELAEAFELAAVTKSPVSFDVARLLWFNGQHLRSLPPERVARLALPFLEKAGLPVEDMEGVIAGVDAALENATLLAEIPTYARIFLGSYELQEDARAELAIGHVPQVLDAFRSLILSVEAWNPESIESILATMRETFKPLGIRGRELFHPVRVALTGQNVGPDLIRTIVLLGKEEAFQRLSRAYDISVEMLSNSEEGNGSQSL